MSSRRVMSCITHTGEAAAPVPWHRLAHPWTFNAGVIPWPALALGCHCRHEPWAARRVIGPGITPVEGTMPDYAAIGVLSLPPPLCRGSASLCIKIATMSVWDCFPTKKKCWIRQTVNKRSSAAERNLVQNPCSTPIAIRWLACVIFSRQLCPRTIILIQCLVSNALLVLNFFHLLQCKCPTSTGDK